MEPRIRYTKTPDGVNIAFCEAGEGRPLVWGPATPFSHVQLEWTIPQFRSMYERLVASGYRLIRYDPRGIGLSDRKLDQDFRLEARVSDLAAVVDALGLSTFVLCGSGDGGMEAIAYAARNPERVSHLILWCAWAKRSDVSGNPQTKSLRALLDQDWMVYTETAARVLLGWSSEAEARQVAAFYRECASPDVLQVSVPAVYASDVTDLLPQVKCPTLVMQRRNLPTVSTDVARELATGIPDSRLLILEGRSPLPFMEDVDSVLSAMADFLGEAAPVPAARNAPTGAEAPVAILFTDMEGSTPMTQRMGDADAQEVIKVHNRIVRQALAACGGREIKHTGDGLMVSFASATRALECGIAIQRGVSEHLEQHPEAPLHVRVGINVGEPVMEGSPGGAVDYFGTAVQLASRICEMAEPGQVLVSGVVRDLTAGKRFLFADHGEVVPRGFEDAVHVYEARW